MRPRLLWPIFGEVGQAWRIRVEGISPDVDFDLLVRMEDRFLPKDFFVVPPADVVVRFPQWLTQQIPTKLARFWCQSRSNFLIGSGRSTSGVSAALCGCFVGQISRSAICDRSRSGSLRFNAAIKACLHRDTEQPR